MKPKVIKSLILDAVSYITTQVTRQPTLEAKKVPSVLHEPAILGGYRVPYKPWKYYFFSLFQIHNETLNIWTHLIGSLLIIQNVLSYCNEFTIGEDNIMSVVIAFSLSGFTCTSISTVVHLLHSRSPYAHFVGFTIDYIGAAMIGFGYGVACFYGIAEYKTYVAYKDFYLGVITIVAFINFMSMCTSKILYGHDPHIMRRKYMMLAGMTLQSIVNLIPVWPRYKRCYFDDSCSISSLNHISAMILNPLLQALAFAAHQPESTWPGKFDVIGHGHQIFHLLVIHNVFNTNRAIYKDYTLGITKNNYLNLSTALSVILALILIELFVLKYLIRYVPRNLKQKIR